MSLRGSAQPRPGCGRRFRRLFRPVFFPSRAGSDQRDQAARMDGDALFFLGIRRGWIRCLSLMVDLFAALQGCKVGAYCLPELQISPRISHFTVGLLVALTKFSRSIFCLKIVAALAHEREQADPWFHGVAWLGLGASQDAETGNVLCS
jgi:hypothetical protein